MYICVIKPLLIPSKPYNIDRIDNCEKNHNFALRTSLDI